MERPRILVIEDEAKLAEVVSAYLENAGFSVTVAGDGANGLALARRLQPALVVLDLMLPDLAGEEVCRALRNESDVPILMLTAKAAEEDRLRGFWLGADDYVTKPFSPRELVARVTAILKRAGEEGPAGLLTLDAGRVVVDAVRFEVRKDGSPVVLTASEFRVLHALAKSPGRVFTRSELMERAQGYDFAAYERTVDAHIKNLRQKIEDDPKHPRYLETVRGVGYRFSPRTASAGPALEGPVGKTGREM